jgi:hypothetical protein
MVSRRFANTALETSSCCLSERVLEDADIDVDLVEAGIAYALESMDGNRLQNQMDNIIVN